MTDSKNDKKELNINYEEEFKPELKDSDDYKLLNKVYEENLKQVEDKINNYFDNIERIKVQALKGSLELAKSKYQTTIKTFEDEINTLAEELEKVDKSNEAEVKRVKRKMDNLITSISEEREAERHFTEIVNKLEAELKALKMKDIQDPEYIFSLLKKTLDFSFTNGDKTPFSINFAEVVPDTSSSVNYKLIKTSKSLKNTFTCSIKIKSIDESASKEGLNYLIGVLEGDTVNLNDDTFFSSCAFLQSSGRALTLFTKEEMDTQHFDEGWKKDDVITVSRDSTNSISFDINGKTKSIFSNITEDLKVVICVKSSINEGTFEIIEAKN